MPTKCTNWTSDVSQDSDHVALQDCDPVLTRSKHLSLRCCPRGRRVGRRINEIVPELIQGLYKLVCIRLCVI